MGKKKELMSSAPWCGVDEDESDIFEDAKMKITRQPRGKYVISRFLGGYMKFPLYLLLIFLFNLWFVVAFYLVTGTLTGDVLWKAVLGRVFTVDKLVKPLPPVMAYNVSRHINFFLRIGISL
ncbi:uncharacterized protein LOC144547773 [Carex rostrata]